MYRDLLQISNKKTLNKKWAEGLSRHSINICKWPMKRCPTSLVIREIYIKITTRYHFILKKIVKIKKIDSTKS